MTGYSFTEVEAILTKAARGNGAGVAHAARFGKAGALCLCADEGAKLINAALRTLPNGVIVENASDILNAMGQATSSRMKLQGGDPLWIGYIDTLPYQSVQETDGSFTVQLDIFSKPERPSRLYIDAANMNHWQALAAKTYVPESEESRHSGAGAGLTDND